jgi:lipopolysaccharide/colanic/teichoic acid biosynthesis glycosyltransferase
MALDLRYVELWSLGLDIQILRRTLPVVVRATGAV